MMPFCVMMAVERQVEIILPHMFIQLLTPRDLSKLSIAMLCANHK